MYYISQPPGVSLEEHITLLEGMYSQAFEDEIDAKVLDDIWHQIQALYEKLNTETVSLSAKEKS